MNGRWTTFLPSSLFARMALILLAGLLAAQSLSLWLHWGERATVVTEARGLHMADRIAEAIRALEADQSPAHRNAIARLQSDDLRIAPIGENQVSPHSPRGQIHSTIAARLGSEREIRSQGGMGGGMGTGFGAGMGRTQQDSGQRSFDVRLKNGQWVRIEASLKPSAPALPNDFYVHLLVSLGIIVLVVMLVVRQATKPLQQLAQAADNLGQDLDAPSLPETGSAELRTAAQAFNRMQARIKRLVDERARALAAVSHDLRTPLTRLRLRTELVDDERLREQMAADLDAMAAMLDASLDYLRGLQDSEPARPIDVNALLQTLVEDNAVQGRELGLAGEADKPYPGRLAALQRAVQNLIDNAFKYGRDVRLTVSDSDETLRLTVEDNGPGVPPAELERLGTPYYRPDAARRSATGGVGLGLSIARDVAALHGGTLELANRPGGGFSATLRLPRMAAGEPT